MSAAGVLDRDLAAEHLAERAARLLARAGSVIEARGLAYAVRFARGRKPMLTLDEAAFRKLAARLIPRPEGGWRLARAAPTPPPGRPGFVEGEKVVIDDGQATSHRANLGQNPLDWLFSRGLLSAVERAAGERLASDAQASGLLGRLTMNWDPTPRGGGSGLAPAERALAAKTRMARAMMALAPEQRAILSPVCLHGASLQATEVALGLKPRTGKAALRAALQRLAAHYGMV